MSANVSTVRLENGTDTNTTLKRYVTNRNWTTYGYILISMESINVLLHSLCLSLLIKVYQDKNGSKTHQLHLINLSLAELTGNFLELISTVINLTMDADYFPINVFIFSFGYIYILALFLLTADRLAATVSHIRYRAICTVSRTKRAIVSTWVISFAMVSSIVLVSNKRGNWHDMESEGSVLAWFNHVVLNIIFFLFAVISYIVMFIVFLRSARSSFPQEKNSILHMFKHSNFYIATLLTSSFLMLWSYQMSSITS